MPRYWVRFTGQVQGVGFRWFLARAARQHHLAGYAENMGDGSVVAEIQGLASDLAGFLAAARAGNGYSDISELDIRNMAEDPSATDFVIITG